MSFSSNVRNNAVPEWRDFYVDYDKLKSRIKRKNFKELLYVELMKINNFYFLLERKAVEEKNKIFDDVFTEMPDENFEDLRAQTEDGYKKEREYEEYGSMEEEGNKCESSKVISEDSEDFAESESSNEEDNDERTSDTSSGIADSLKEQIGQGLKKFLKLPKGITKRRKEKVITEFLHTLVRITTYKDLNSSAMLKLAKRHSKKYSGFYEEFERKFHETYLYKSHKIEQIRVAIKQLYKRLFAKNQPEKAKKVFKRIRKGLESSDWLLIYSGFLFGVAYVLSLSTFSPYDSQHALFWAINNIYVGFFGFGLCIKVFKSVGINYKFIFNFDVCSTMNNALYLTTFSTLLALNLAFYYFFNAYDKAYLCFILVNILLMAIPIDIFFWHSRYYFLGVYGRVLLQPLSTIRFRHFYFADVAQSFSGSIQQLFFSFGLKNEAVLVSIAAIFPFIRVLQCIKRYHDSKMFFPHVLNCAKFISGLIFHFFKHFNKTKPEYKIFFLVFGFFSTTFSLLWDYFMDWGTLTRTTRLFPSYIYFVFLWYNLMARSFWIFKFCEVYSNAPAAFESLLEIVRRLLWTILRVEVEHLNNCDEFKMKNAISLTARELFYKKDQAEIYREQQYGYETETETEEVFHQKIESQNSHVAVTK